MGFLRRSGRLVRKTEKGDRLLRSEKLPVTFLPKRVVPGGAPGNSFVPLSAPKPLFPSLEQDVDLVLQDGLDLRQGRQYALLQGFLGLSE